MSDRTYATITVSGSTDIPKETDLPYPSSATGTSLQTAQSHPIDDLIDLSTSKHEYLLRERTYGVAEAARRYREKRGRHPPPRFDEWVAFAEEHGCLVIEEMFDQIYHDLNPFWGMPAQHIRALAIAVADQGYIEIVKGKATKNQERPFIDSYFDTIQQIQGSLPDMRIPVNSMDESAVLVPYTTIEENVKAWQRSLSRQDLTNPPLSQDFTSTSNESAESIQVEFVRTRPYWDLAKAGCAPNTPAAKTKTDADFSTSPVFPKRHPYGSYKGYVQNYTRSQDVCHHTDLRNLHGTFINPVTVTTTKNLVPMFGSSKLLLNNDIIFPAAVYWNAGDLFSPEKELVSWPVQADRVYWRGIASGGRNTVDNWTRFQRHRLVSMLNGTQVAMTLRGESTHSLPHNFPLPNEELYPPTDAHSIRFTDVIKDSSDAAFFELECFPRREDGDCDYTGPYYSRAPHVPMAQMFKNKYLPDVDGNAFSGRFRAFLLSNSLPIKSTIYTEWHDRRLVPWKHFVPMDNTYMDLWGILDFFWNNDAKAQKIAIEGREWAEKVLRREDIVVYMYRLLLEYARVVDPNREDIGYGSDLGVRS